MKILLSEQVRELDLKTISEGHASGFELMERAGKGAAIEINRFIKTSYPSVNTVIILAGKGNNGGDGFVVARYLSKWGFKVKVCLIAKIDSLKGDAAEHYKKIPNTVNCQFCENLNLSNLQNTLIIDALLGTGLKGAPDGKFADWINSVNSSFLPTVSLDIPSGLNSDTGKAYIPCIKANMTITFGVPKRGLFIENGLTHTGILRFVDIGIAPGLIEQYESTLNMLTDREALMLLPRHPQNAHKFSRGHLAVIAGSGSFTGAPSLTSLSAAFSAAGFITLLYPEKCEIRNIKSSIVERKLPSENGIFSYFSMTPDFYRTVEKADAICVGPGLTASDEIIPMINFLWNLEKKILFDADALNIIAKFTPSKRRYDAVLTPHEGEFKRLLSAYKISSDMDRFSLAQKLAELIGVVVVLKGPRTVIVSPGKKIYVNPTGSVALASAGTGDVLSGIIASLCAQGLDCFNASILGTFIHGRLSEISGKDFLTSDKLVELLAELKHNEIFFDNR